MRCASRRKLPLAATRSRRTSDAGTTSELLWSKGSTIAGRRVSAAARSVLVKELGATAGATPPTCVGIRTLESLAPPSTLMAEGWCDGGFPLGRGGGTAAADGVNGAETSTRGGALEMVGAAAADCAWVGRFVSEGRVDVGAVVAEGAGVTGLVAATGSVRAGDVDTSGVPNASGRRPLDLASTPVVGSGPSGSAAAPGESESARVSASARDAPQTYLASPRPRRSQTQMLTQSPPSLADCFEKARWRGAGVNPSP